MCGIVGYVGKKRTVPFLLEGLSRLEYRGYDSMGLVCFDAKTRDFQYAKVVGGIDVLREKISSWDHDGHSGLSHSRWATHGGVSSENAHPHFDCTNRIAIVHNGIIENYLFLKNALSSHKFVSVTDTEIVAHYLEELLLIHTSLHEAIHALVNILQGAFSLVILIKDYPDTIIAIRKRSPLCIGYAENAFFVASDPQAFVEHTQQVLFMEDETYAIITLEKQEYYDFAGNSHVPQMTTIDFGSYGASQEQYQHFMVKEIYEQKRVIYDTVTSIKNLSDQELLHSCGLSHQAVASLNEVVLVGCGTSSYAASVARFFLEKLVKVHVTVKIASEYRFENYFDNPHRLMIFLSQSGETADTLEAMRVSRTHARNALAITNIPTSTITREADGVLLMQAKREVAVASTKCFTAQVALLYAWAFRIASLRDGTVAVEKSYHDLWVIAENLEFSLDRYKPIIQQQLAAHYSQFNKFIFIGRRESFAFAQEAALKLKEIVYAFVDCYPAGELKHGPLALIEENIPVFIFSLLDDEIYAKLVSNAQEVKARKGAITVFAFEGQTELIELADHAFVFPRVEPLLAPFVFTSVMQYLVYEIARHLNRPIDKPRNLAKTVTVE